MSAHTLEADYLVVGSGAAGMAFADSLITETDSQVVMVDRRVEPGGHWNDAYPVVRLHQPSLYYGVNSMPLGGGAIESSGREAGMYERASGAEIRAYYERVMYKRLIPSGQVRFLPQCEYLGDGRLVSRLSGRKPMKPWRRPGTPNAEKWVISTAGSCRSRSPISISPGETTTER